MICPKCRQKVQSGSRFCEFCGTALPASPQPGGAGTTGGASYGVGASGRGLPGAGTTGSTSYSAGTSGRGLPGAGTTGSAPYNTGNNMFQGNPTGSGRGGYQGQIAGSGGNIPPTGSRNTLPRQGMMLPQNQNNSFAGGQGAPPHPLYGRAKPAMDSKKRNILIGGIAGALVLFIVAALLLSNRKTKIDLNKYVSVSFSGYDTRGNATIDVDYENMAKDLQQALGHKTSYNQNINSLSDIDWSDVADEISSLGDYATVMNGVSWKLDKTDNLSNGDTVTLTYDFDNDAVKSYKIKFVGKQKEISVSGLTAVRELDPFQDVSVEFSGTSPNASAQIVNNSSQDELQSLNYSISKSSGIKKGDTVTVSVKTEEDDLLAAYGCTLSTTTKEFTCEDVDEYVASVEDIDDSTMDSMKKQTKDAISSYFASNRSEIRKGSLTYEGAYFLNRKESDDWDAQNMIYIVYSTNVRSISHSFKTRKVYLPVKFENIILYSDGSSYVNLNSTDIHGTTDLSFGWWNHVAGYTKENAMKSELVSSRKGEYNTQSVGNLS